LPDELAPEHSAIIIEVMGDECRPRPFGCLEKFVQDLRQLPPHPEGVRVRDAMDPRRISRDYKSVRPDDMASGVFGISPEVVASPGDLNKVGPAVDIVGRKIAATG
jgi:hypothetical protein